MRILRNFSLKKYNSFGIEARASRFVSVQKIEDLKILLRGSYASEVFILGGGSNMLITKDIQKTVLHIDLRGKEIISEDDDEVILKVCAGENWHQLVLYAIEKGYGGLENLSLIPGNVGTSPIQNIGAYGVELKDTFLKCDTLNVQSLEEKEFSLEECKFDYRNSVFKTELKGQYIITAVYFRLTKRNHKKNIEYGAIKEELEKNHISSPTPKDISNAVIAIRQSKLPDPKELGNSGSFFKNPVISIEDFNNMKSNFPDMPSYPISASEVKVPAGWLIDQAGLKGYRDGDAGVHKNQALVLVNYGNASGADILNLSAKIQSTVKDKFGIDLEPEVNII
ncbi:UDP-N-acetylmuramate dehydrogenase [Gramella sp. AN32]|uniref:UDP-N-acetylenolpyruvoylglucosamine reductase n=1 Tax=Christiangramia antarctica TaxID=2058158 RepID=A0ABW5X8Y0_9FLAO|nr:UDP-N-acetylmuramate dehydrogenase [Gramella sp. AN32]MCM4155909.1 UDP-N-acetylenolpyruvoylglucosamine reductase [Gramella sp. AN32]